MTGISVTAHGSQSKESTPAQRYSDLKQAPERYSIIQLGIALYFYHDTSSDTAVTSVMSSSSSATTTTSTTNQDHMRSTGVSRLPSSPVRSRGYTVAVANATTGTPAKVLTTASNVEYAPGSIPPGTTYSVRRYNFYMFPSAAAATPPFTDRNAHKTPTTSIPPVLHQPQDIVLNISAIAFLNGNNMSLDIWTRQGIPYATSVPHASTYLESYLQHELRVQREAQDKHEHQQTKPATIQDAVRKEVELRRPEDIEFHARTMATLREWLDIPIVTSTSNAATNNENVDPFMDYSLLLPPCNSFLRRALYESIQKEYPALILEKYPNNTQQIRVLRLDPQEQVVRQQHLQKERYVDLIQNKIGVYRIFEALRLVCNGKKIDSSNVLFAKSYEDVDWGKVRHDDDNKNINHGNIDLTETVRDGQDSLRKIPLVVHNGFMDLCFLMTHFAVSYHLPDSYQECKQMIHSYFPIIYDTKTLATEYVDWDDDASTASNERQVNTGLSSLFQMLARDPNHYYNNLSREANNANHRILLDDIYVVPTPVEATSLSTTVSSVPIEDQEHEAAYDAYMTGVIFVGLCQRIHQQLILPMTQQGEDVPQIDNPAAIIPIDSNCDIHQRNVLRMFFGLNMLHQMSIYTMDLEEMRYNRDPMGRRIDPQYTYRVFNIDTTVSTRDIVTSLSNLTDTKNQQVNFLIIWIDDTTFLVATLYRHRPSSLSQQDGSDEQQQQRSESSIVEREEGEEVQEDLIGSPQSVSLIESIVKNQTNVGAAILLEHGNIIHRALQKRFDNGEVVITVHEDYLAQVATGHLDHLKIADEVKPASWINRMSAIFGWSTKPSNVKRSLDQYTESSTKRQRIQ
jgi:CAF1 family ribonuclease